MMGLMTCAFSAEARTTTDALVALRDRIEGGVGGSGSASGRGVDGASRRASSRSIEERSDSNQYLRSSPSDDTNAVRRDIRIRRRGDALERAIDPSAHVPDGGEAGDALAEEGAAGGDLGGAGRGGNRQRPVFQTGCVVAGDWAKRGHPVAAGKPREGARATRDAGTATHLGGGDARGEGGVDNSGHFVDWVECDGRWLGAKMTRAGARTRLLQASRPPGQWERVWIAPGRALIGC